MGFNPSHVVVIRRASSQCPQHLNRELYGWPGRAPTIADVDSPGISTGARLIQVKAPRPLLGIKATFEVPEDLSCGRAGSTDRPEGCVIPPAETLATPAHNDLHVAEPTRAITTAPRSMTHGVEHDNQP